MASSTSRTVAGNEPSASWAADMFTATLNVSGTPSARQVGELGAGLLEHDAAERDVEPRFLGDGDEVARVEQTALGMLPPHERLDPVDQPGAEIEHRLVVHAAAHRRGGP